MFQGFGPPGDLRGPFLQSVSRICCPGAAPAISGGPFLMSVSRIRASRRSPRPVFEECFKDLPPPEFSPSQSTDGGKRWGGRKIVNTNVVCFKLIYVVPQLNSSDTFSASMPFTAHRATPPRSVTPNDFRKTQSRHRGLHNVNASVIN